MSLPEFDFHYRHFLDHTTNVYGGSGTGKSYVIRDIGIALRDHVDQVFVFCPTDRANPSYSGWIPPPCVHYDVKIDILTNIWDRQTALASVYNRVHRQPIISSILRRLPDGNHILNTLAKIRANLDKYIEEINNSDESGTYKRVTIENNKIEVERLCRLIYIKTISKAAPMLAMMDLSTDEAFSVKFINLNPRMLIIFDDATDQLLKIKNNPIMMKMFYQCRWVYLSIICAAHTDKAFLPEIKKNCFVSIFTEDISAQSYFVRPSNDFSKDQKKSGLSATSEAFVKTLPNQKLVYIRDLRAMYKYTASAHPGVNFIRNEILRSYFDKILIPVGTIAVDNNRFAGAFK